MGYNVKWVEQESGRNGLFYWHTTTQVLHSVLFSDRVICDGIVYELVSKKEENDVEHRRFHQ